MNKRFGTVLMTAAVLMIGWVQPRAQQDPNDQGVADTVRMEFTVVAGREYQPVERIHGSVSVQRRSES